MFFIFILLKLFFVNIFNTLRQKQPKRAIKSSILSHGSKKFDIYLGYSLATH